MRAPSPFRSPDVPDSGDEALVEERAADLPRGHLAQPLDHRVVGGLLIEDVRPEPRAASSVQLEDRAVPEHRLVLVAAQDEPGPAGAGSPARLDAPATGHPQVAAQDVAALEAEEEVLARRLHRFEHEAVQPLGQPLGGRARMGRLHVEPLADERLQPQRRPVERVTFGHEA
jgi:hypothetical protein